MQKTPERYSERWIQVDGLKVRYLQEGSGPPLVLVHGLLGYSADWRPIIAPLAERYEVFVPDLPGSGFSECSPRLDCCLRAAAGRLLKFLDEVGIGSCDVIASSYGGATAMFAASLDRARFKRLVLVSPANPWSRFGRKRIMLLGLPVVSACFPAVGRWATPVRWYFLRRMYGNPKRLTAETMLSHSQPLDRLGVLEHGVGIVKTWWEDMRELEGALPSVSKIPTLIVWGTRDRTVDPASAAPLSKHFEKVQTARIEGAGHLPYEECPEEFLNIVEPFLYDTPPMALRGK